MSRPLRIQYKDAWYHAMNRGRRGERIFWDSKDYAIFIESLMESSKQWDVKTAAYCLMSTHYHLLVQTPKANLSRFMRHLNGVFTQRFNRRHNFEGQLFKGRYKSVLVGEENYLLELIRYIHFDPVRAGLVKKPADYEWSSFRAYQKKRDQDRWIYTQYLFRLSDGKDNGVAIDRQETIARDATDEIYEFFSRGNLRSILGSEEFCEKIRRKFYGGNIDPEIPEAKDFTPDFKIIVSHTAQTFKTSKRDILKVERGCRNWGRDTAIYLCRRITRSRLADIGRYFNNRKYSAVSNAVKRVETELGKNKKLAKAIHKLTIEITQASS